MPLKITCASLETQGAILVEFLKRHLTPESDKDRFSWLYEQNPSGLARAWIASDTYTGLLVGAAAAFPRKFYSQGTMLMGWVLGDFCFAEGYRSMGPAVQLQRACLDALLRETNFCYDFPSKPMMAIYKRLGFKQTSSLVRWAKPLRIEEKLKPILRSSEAAKAVGKIANVLLAARGWKGARDACEIQLLDGPCGEEFSAFDESLNMGSGLRSVRSAEYLNWRFLSYGKKTHRILTARKNGHLTAYAVITDDPRNARIVDLVSVEEPGVIARLIDSAVASYMVLGAESVTLTAGAEHPWNSIFHRAGFRRREESPIVVVPQETAVVETPFSNSWYLMEGERDS